MGLTRFPLVAVSTTVIIRDKRSPLVKRSNTNCACAWPQIHWQGCNLSGPLVDISPMDQGSSLSCTTLQDLGRVIPYTHKWPNTSSSGQVQCPCLTPDPIHINRYYSWLVYWIRAQVIYILSNPITLVKLVAWCFSSLANAITRCNRVTVSPLVKPRPMFRAEANVISDLTPDL